MTIQPSTETSDAASIANVSPGNAVEEEIRFATRTGTSVPCGRMTRSDDCAAAGSHGAASAALSAKNKERNALGVVDGMRLPFRKETPGPFCGTDGPCDPFEKSPQMKYKLTSDPTEIERSFTLVFEPGDEVVAQITAFARAQRVTAGRLTGIGGFSVATLGYFDKSKKIYEPIAIDEQVELLSLLGTLAMKDGEPLLHAHAVVGRRDGSVSGGHLLSATVWPTLELFIDSYALTLVKRDRPELGVATIAV
jgi:uncharacterized protein